MRDDGPVKQPDLAALIGSRICHDLISPVGAIGNGVELLSMSGSAGPELALIADSVENAKARIRFFRIAFGQSSPGQMVSRMESLTILNDMYRGSRLKVRWSPAADSLRCEVRIAFLLLQCFESAMPYGGDIDVRSADGQWTLDGSAQKTKQDETLWQALEDGEIAQVTANHVHFALLPGALAGVQRRLTVARSESRIVATF